MRVNWLAWSAVDSVGGVILAFAVTVLFARVLEPADFGRFALALGLVQLASVATEALLHDAVVQRQELEDAHAHTAVWTIAALGLALMLLMLLGAHRFADLAGDPSIAPLVGALALSIPLAGVSSVLTAQLRRA
ncbi:MAG TPA: oligosaccharide flippase family protein, partial [Burkholderiaceae bacterium]|nr:oligosaccharide flippase family protein [Burkholderiaceae bacterium]